MTLGSGFFATHAQFLVCPLIVSKVYDALSLQQSPHDIGQLMCTSSFSHSRFLRLSFILTQLHDLISSLSIRNSLLLTQVLVGFKDGCSDGDLDGLLLGLCDDVALGDQDGGLDGCTEGDTDGLTVGDMLGVRDGEAELSEEGRSVGEVDGKAFGIFDGKSLGNTDGVLLGAPPGMVDGNKDIISLHLLHADGQAS